MTIRRGEVVFEDGQILTNHHVVEVAEEGGTITVARQAAISRNSSATPTAFIIATARAMPAPMPVIAPP